MGVVELVPAICRASLDRKLIPYLFRRPSYPLDCFRLCDTSNSSSVHFSIILPARADSV